MKKYDLVVVGGGLTGVAASVSAAREGLSVLLVEQSGSLGGAISQNLVYPFMTYWTTVPETGETKDLSAGIFKEMQQRQQVYLPRSDRKRFDPESFKCLLDDMVREAGVEVLFHGTLCGAQVESGRIQSILLATKAGLWQAEGENFIDATGDGDLMAFAGCDFQLGRESDGLCQPMTTCFRLCDVDLELFRADRPRLQELYQQEQAAGRIQNPRENILVFFGLGSNILHFNTTRVVKLDPTDPLDVSQAEMQARAQVFEMLRFLQANTASCKDARVVSVATSIGVRESRKLRGEHILTVEELKACTRFPDAIALGNYDVDIHSPDGAGTSHHYFPAGQYYTIPYRCLLPKELDNLLVAGRCLSATHEAQASVRIMPICATTGQAAGMAAALAHSTGATPKTLDIAALQEKLRQAGAAID